jgi:hypothetical protein
MVDHLAGRPDTVTAGPVYVSWAGVIAGAIVAAALWFVLITFGAAIGLAMASPSATWRDTSVALLLLSGIWILLASLASSSLGGYLAGRMRSSWSSSAADEVDFRDGVHGLLVWGLGILIGAALAAGAARSVAPGTGNLTSPTAATAEPLLAYELDRLLRSDRRPAQGEASDADVRAQATRIISTSLGHADMTADDRAYLVRLVGTRTGLAAPDAERRVTEVLAQARRAVRRARANAVILAFSAAASMLLGAAAAWFAAGLGGHHRDAGTVPSLWVSRPATPVTRVP